MKWRKISLTKNQLQELNKAEKQIQNSILLKRIQCIKLKHEDWKNNDLAKLFNVTHETISHWIAAYSKGGINELLKWNYKGKISTLSLKQQEILKKQNKKKPFDTAKEAKAFIEKKFGLNFHLHHVQKLLKKNFVYHTKKQN
jgi:transposase